MTTVLEVAVRQARDVPGCVEGGADRLALDVDGRSPDVATAAAVVRAGDLPVRVLLRLDETFTARADDLARLVALGREYVAVGAEGVCLGFLDADLEVDVATTRALVEALPGVGWTFHRAVDATLDLRRSWRRLLTLPGLTAVASGGSPQGLDHGYDDLLALAAADPAVARLLMPAGGLAAEQVPWFVRAGVRQFHVGPQVRPGGSDRAYVDAGLVRSWRLLLDSAPVAGRERSG
ncbi:copper homeostasis protein CutC [Nocardioides dongxiaopingii]|uniref:copper homeostasis protein CutC n=1 Tax=Nocardioides sp. S-1144 TaxID=2582905 RepID=UPI00110DC9DB|nr:copper homeostasis protein CutC [Nocardioides sp. S-1144]QCW51753.1 copper homeostasis protein CutC [Nocardioides sp. S-1144]